LLKTRNLLIFRDAKNAENCQIAPNWNVSGTRDFDLFTRRGKKRSSAPAKIRTFNPLPRSRLICKKCPLKDEGVESGEGAESAVFVRIFAQLQKAY
jgi:hypothetical protein